MAVPLVQELHYQHFAESLAFAGTMFGMINEDPGIVVSILDEAHIHLNGCVNKKKGVIEPHSHPQASLKVIWLAGSVKRLL